jgi:AraC family transcriptional activator of tynA and feaB
MGVSNYCTQDIKENRQLEYWNEVICKEFTQLQCETQNTSAYRGELTTWDLNSVQMSKVCAEPSGVYHSRSLVSKSPEDLYLMHVQIEGESTNTQAGREAHLKPGDFTICSSTSPYALIFDKPIEMLVVRIPTSLMNQHFSATAEEILARRISGEDQLGSVIYSLLMRLWLNKDNIDIPSQNANICNSILSLLAVQLDMITPKGVIAESSVRAAHVQRIKMHIERHLSNPELSPSSVAHANGVSPRYLRLLFETEGVTCSRYIANRRLEEIARDLSNPMSHRTKITQIAYRWGFNNPSHFSRVFREHFGSSAQNFRRARLSDD